MMELKKYSILSEKFKDKDPRMLPYLYPTSLNVVAYAKQMQEFNFQQCLAVAEDIAHKQGLLLIPSSCLHWQRAKNFGYDRKVKVGRHSFYLLKLNELTKVEKIKLENYLNEELQKDIKIG